MWLNGCGARVASRTPRSSQWLFRIGRWYSYEGTGRLAFSSEAQKLGQPFRKFLETQNSSACNSVLAYLRQIFRSHVWSTGPLSYGRRPRLLSGWMAGIGRYL